MEFAITGQQPGCNILYHKMAQEQHSIYFGYAFFRRFRLGVFLGVLG